jgi:predicted nucleic acid-binding protein
MKYLLDTDTVIDVIQDREQVRGRISALIEGGDEVAVCAITLAELYSGLPDARREKWQGWLSALPYWEVSRGAAEQAGIYRKAGSAAGKTLHVPDCLIAACAAERGATVLSSNTKDYESMHDIVVMSLRERAA